jgi:RNA polymerase sigma factor (sigma-70 family)
VSATARPLSTSILKPLARESDLRLVELSRTGDERAFEVLVRRHRHELHVYAGRLMGAEGRAEDALQHALMSAWMALRDRGAEVANPRAWLYGIVHNSAVSVLRRARHDTVELNEALEAPHPYAGPETNAIVGEIFAGLAQMSAPQRQALLMTAVAGSSHGEAASALGVSDNAVRGMVYRARAALRQAAAAVLPPGLVNGAVGLGHRRPRFPVDPVDAAAATSASAGVAGAVVKGGAVIAAVGALAGAAGPALLPTARGHHHRPAAVHQPASTRHGSPGPRARRVRASGVNAPQLSLPRHHDPTAIAGTDAKHSDIRARGHDDGRGVPGEGSEHGDRSGAGDGPGSGGGDTGSSSNGGSPGGDSPGRDSPGRDSGSGSSNGSSSASGSNDGSSASGSSGRGRGSTTSAGSGSSGSGSSGSGSSGSGHGDIGAPAGSSGSIATPSAGSSGSSSGSGPGPAETDQGAAADPAPSPATSPADASGGGDSGGHSGGSDGGQSGSSGS